MDPVVHFEMPAKDTKRMNDFYGTVFGWQTKDMGEDMGGYVLATTTEVDENQMPKKAGAINGGFYVPEKGETPHPSLVIEVKDIQASMKKVVEAGGSVLGEPQAIPGIGDFVSLTDTEGNRISMLQPTKV